MIQAAKSFMGTAQMANVVGSFFLLFSASDNFALYDPGLDFP